MSFSVSNLSLTLDVWESLRKIQNEVFRSPAPPFLHHYTSSFAVESIVRGRGIWARCIADQMDGGEISHTSGMIARSAEEVASSGLPAFHRDVLLRLPFFMEERKAWVFIACFCGDNDSQLHWSRYGKYRLTFPAPWTDAPSLKLDDPQAECWYQPIVYDERVQRRAMERALEGVVLALSRHTRGENVGPWAKAMVDSCARNIAQQLLGFAVGFKQRSFKNEKEWRIVCSPRLGSDSSAPSSVDGDFSVNIKPLPRRVVLHIAERLNLSQPLLIPKVPFMDWSWDPKRYDAEEVDAINRLLEANHRADLVRKP